MVLQGLLPDMTWPNHGNFRRLIVREENPLDPRVFWHCSVQTHWFCALSRRWASSSNCSWPPGSFFLHQPCFTPVEDVGYDQRFVNLELCIEADIALAYSFQSDHICYGCGDPFPDLCIEGCRLLICLHTSIWSWTLPQVVQRPCWRWYWCFIMIFIIIN